jgi:hypothetical protein
MDFNEIGPRLYAKVPTEADPATAILDWGQARPLTDLGKGAVGADDPPASHQPIADSDPFGLESCNLRAPAGYDSGRFHPIQKDLVQSRATDAYAAFIGKARLCDLLVVGESDAAKRQAMAGAENDAELAQGRDAIRHHAFPASLVDRGLGPIYHADFEPVSARG